MERERLQRDDRAASVFASLLAPIHCLFGRIKLDEQEIESLDRDLCAWFLRLTRRTGCERLSERAMRAALLTGAVKLMREVATLKQCAVPLLPEDIGRIADQLGIELESHHEASQ